MKASTARSIETIFWLGVWGLGIWWFANNILPLITQAIRQGVQATPTPTTPSQPAGGGISGLPGIDIGQTIAGLPNDVWNLLSGLGKQGALMNKTPTSTSVPGGLSAEDVANLTPTVKIGRGSGYGRSWLSQEEIERRLALAAQRSHTFSPGGGGTNEASSGPAKFTF
jgi:hypothetical protein